MRSIARASFAKQLDAFGLWVALGLLGIVLALGILSTLALIDGTAWVDHTHRVIESLAESRLGITLATNARRGFALTGDGDQLSRYQLAIEQLNAAEGRVRSLTVDDASQQKRLDVLEPLLLRRRVRLDAALAYRQTHGFDLEQEARETLEGTATFAEVNTRFDEITAEEVRLLSERKRHTAEVVLRTELMQGVVACLSLGLFVAVVIRLRREIRRRERSEQAQRESERAIKGLNEELERRVLERTAQLERSNRELEAFGYSVVHDLRAPLRGMGGFAEVLLNDSEDTLSADARDSLHEIRENARRMAVLIDALVAMSRITRSEMMRTPVNLAALVQATAAGLAPRPGLSLICPDVISAEVDLALARTLIEILLGNAWKFTGKIAEARIELGVTEADDERIYFIRDNGAGFDMAHAAKLFAPFGRLHTAREFPGDGIGLATAQRVVQRHGGRIWADGRVGGGATFYFTLPKPGEGTT